METRFDVFFLEDAIDFMSNLDAKSRKKIYYNIDKARFKNDPKLFEKLEGEIWYFRTKFLKLQYRIFAFWDKTSKVDTLVIATHGIIKKTQKTPKSEIAKAERIRIEYFENKKL